MSSKNAFIRFIPLIVLCVLVCVGAAVALGMARKPHYTAEATLNVGKLDAQTQALPGFIQGATSLASSYSRVATSDRLQRKVARKTNIPLSEVRGNLAAAPVPGAPVMRINGTADTSRDAIRLTSGATDALVEYIHGLATGNDAARKLLTRYRNVSARAVTLQQRVKAA